MERQRANGTFGLVLLVLGGTFAITALTKHPLLGLGGGCVGGLAALWIASRDGDQQGRRGHHANLTLGGVCAHRVLEGVALGALYTASASVGVVGVVVIAGHTALETAAVGGLYIPHRSKAFAAIALVQIGYIVGAGAGVGVSMSVPVSVRITSVGLMAGVLLIVGVGEMKHSSSAPAG